MGIQPEVAAYIAKLKLPIGFSVCELGDQGMCGEPTKRLSKEWYAELGCGRYVSVDGNGRGTFTADLNQPIALIVNAMFDLVTDFGTGEHIFDQAQIWRSLHDLVKPGGYIAVDRPSSGYEKHCFYVTHEGLYRDIAEANGYKVLHLDRRKTPRGELVFAVFQRQTAEPFRVPQQGRYRESLVIA